MPQTSFATYPHCTQYMNGSPARPQNIEYVTLQTLKKGGKTDAQAMNKVIDMIFHKLNEQVVQNEVNANMYTQVITTKVEEPKLKAKLVLHRSLRLGWAKASGDMT